jgi:hypothetical protein
MQHRELNWVNIHNRDYACVQVKRDLGETAATQEQSLTCRVFT